MDKQTKKEFDILARMINKRFDGVTSQMAKKEDVDARFDHIEKRMDTLEQGHEEIKLRLDNVAYHFELVELQRRVEILEKRAGVKHR